MKLILENTSVSYYEPLHLWKLNLNPVPSSNFTDSSFIDEWKSTGHTSNLILTAANQEIGIATLEYIPPQTTTM